ncbi:metal ABC transporter substrate-binding protein [Methylococcus capsulatus]|uniref:metal ABC transporter substrate-binding protein n=1 Tax=Methylococcus capsulatus TaxID=414 RepID=UPI001C52CBF0|nr:metal ABC transporter substrate-binding protein [Methylococcus capsulatus]QXP87227.1 metal ABC transporter substrate-binding protein [Methylococcus capsulatus]QXP93093.1 metal ABC transporter substrate-binding protein [Methylococcus capsulatus]UQN12222.1 metal ABC transporter substrate-binding protein [Methylococcus capsulatus]
MPTFRILSFVIALLAAASAWGAGAVSEHPLKIVASNYPLAYFAERLAGSWATVTLPAPADADPAYWRPDVKAVSAMQKADLILLNGADYEKWLAHVALPRLKRVDTSAGFRDRFIRIENAVVHSHGPAGQHSHEGTAYTTWLDFDQAAQQAEAVAKALIARRPELKTAVLDALKALQTDLAGLDGELKRIATVKPGVPLMASHPVYQYLARRYGLNLKSVHWEPGEMPPEKEWTELGKTLTVHPAKTMLWEARPSPAIADKLSAKGVTSVVFDPCANRPESGDFLAVMKRNVENLKMALQR